MTRVDTDKLLEEVRRWIQCGQWLSDDNRLEAVIAAFESLDLALSSGEVIPRDWCRARELKLRSAAYEGRLDQRTGPCDS